MPPRAWLAPTALAAVLTVSSLPVSAEGPAVAEANGRVIANYDYTHIMSDDIFQFVPPPTTVTQSAEIDIDAGGFTGVYTFPVQEAVGARVYGGPTFFKSHTDTFDEITSEGLQFGGDIFVRDPEVGSAGFGTFYQFSELDSGSQLSPVQEGSVNGTEHTAGVRAYGELYLPDVLGFGPVDLDASARFSDSDIDDNGSFSAQRNYTATAGARLYTADNFSLRIGGRYSRTNFGTTGFNETRAMDVDANLLLPFRPNVTLGAGFTVGTVEEAPRGFQNYGRMFFGLGFSATVSFPGAESLVQLNRELY